MINKVHILFENPAWMPPLREALDKAGVPYVEHFVEGGILDVEQVAAGDVVLNRMSPSAHTRSHQGGVQFVKEYLHLLEARGVRVINGSDAFAFEVSKLKQYSALERAGIKVPKTVGIIGDEHLLEAAKTMPLPFITKHNQGGKGLGVQLFRDLTSFEAFIGSDAYQPSPDGVTLLQEYIESPLPHITRVEVVGGRFLYAVRVSTVGGFELCPSDACQVGDAFCPADGSGKFEIRNDVGPEDPTVRAYLDFCASEGIDVAGIEFIEDGQGQRYTYDINGTTNYNQQMEVRYGMDGMGAIAELCAQALADSSAPDSEAAA